MNVGESNIKKWTSGWDELSEIQTSNLNDGFDFTPNRPNQNEQSERREAIFE